MLDRLHRQSRQGIESPTPVVCSDYGDCGHDGKAVLWGATHKLKLFGGKVKLLEWIFNSVSLNGFQTYTE